MAVGAIAAGTLIGGGSPSGLITASIVLLDQATPQLGRVQRAFDRFEKNGFGSLIRGGSASAKVLSQVGQGMLTTAKAAAVFTGVIIAAGRSVAQFEKQIAGIAAITGSASVGEKGIQQVRRQAIELSKQFAFTAIQVAEGQRFIAQTGAKSNEILSSTPEILALAASTLEEFDLAAKLTIKTLHAFGESLESLEETKRTVNALQFAVNNSVNTLQTLNDALKFSAPFANTLGLELEDLVSVLQLTANAGLEAGIAGRSLGQGLQQLIRAGMRGASAEAKVLAGEFAGIIDRGGTLADVVRRLEHEFSGFSEADRRAVRELDDLTDAQIAQIESGEKLFTTTERLSQMIQIFGVRGARVFAVLLGQSGKLDEFRTQMEQQVITAAAQAGVAMDNLASQTQIAMQRVQAAILNSNFSEILKNQLAEINDSGLADDLGETLATTLENMAENVLPAVVSFLELLGVVLQDLQPVFKLTTSVVGALTEMLSMFAGNDIGRGIIQLALGIVLIEKSFRGASIVAAGFGKSLTSLFVKQKSVQKSAVGTKVAMDSMFDAAGAKAVAFLNILYQIEASMARMRGQAVAPIMAGPMLASGQKQLGPGVVAPKSRVPRISGRNAAIAAGSAVAIGAIGAGFAKSDDKIRGGSVLGASATGAAIGMIGGAPGIAIGAGLGALTGVMLELVRVEEAKLSKEEGADASFQKAVLEADGDPASLFAASIERALVDGIDNAGASFSRRFEAVLDKDFVRREKVGNFVLGRDDKDNKFIKSFEQSFGSSKRDKSGTEKFLTNNFAQGAAKFAGKAFLGTVPIVGAALLPKFDKFFDKTVAKGEAKINENRKSIDIAALDFFGIDRKQSLTDQGAQLETALNSQSTKDLFDTLFKQGIGAGLDANQSASIASDKIAAFLGIDPAVVKGLFTSLGAVPGAFKVLTDETTGITTVTSDITVSGLAFAEKLDEFTEDDSTDELTAKINKAKELFNDMLKGDGTAPHLIQVAASAEELRKRVENATVLVRQADNEIEDMNNSLRQAKEAANQMAIEFANATRGGILTRVGGAGSSASFALENADALGKTENEKIAAENKLIRVKVLESAIGQTRINEEIKLQALKQKEAQRNSILEQMKADSAEADLEVAMKSRALAVARAAVEAELLKQLVSENQDILKKAGVDTEELQTALDDYNAALVKRAQEEANLADEQQTLRELNAAITVEQAAYLQVLQTNNDRFQALATELGINAESVEELTNAQIMTIIKYQEQIAAVERLNRKVSDAASGSGGLGAALEQSRDELVKMGFSASAIDATMKQFQKINALNATVGLVNNLNQLASSVGNTQFLDLSTMFGRELLSGASSFFENFLSIGNTEDLLRALGEQMTVQQKVSNSTVVNLEVDVILPEGIDASQRGEIIAIVDQALSDSVSRTSFNP